MFIHFIMVKQLITVLSDSASEEENVDLIKKAMFSLLKDKSATVQRSLKEFSANDIKKQIFELRKQFKN